MSKRKESTNIKCDVESCKHNDYDEGICKLSEIKVSCTCANDECDCTDSTICDSFETENEKE